MRTDAETTATRLQQLESYLLARFPLTSAQADEILCQLRRMLRRGPQPCRLIVHNFGSAPSASGSPKAL